ncbi:MAG TPA: GNAT family N-acetyltransferase [Armatimonadota bacterium]
MKPCHIEAELFADNGDRASSIEFFRSHEFLEAEGVTHSLVLGDAEGPILAAPLVVRAIPGSPLLDAVSPYGFPGGAVLRPARFSTTDVAWHSLNLVSIFIRNRVGATPVLVDGNQRGVVQVVDPSLPMHMRRNHRCDIRSNETNGYVTRCIPARSTTPEERDAFRAMYLRTMERNEARAWYFFSEEYFAALFGSEMAWLVLTNSPTGQPAAGVIVVQSDNLLHCYLSGSADDYLRDAPAKNAFAGAIQFAQEKGMPLNLGGGMRGADSLEHFKKGFANATLPFCTHEIICDMDAYCELSLGYEDSGYFPRYRNDRG